MATPVNTFACGIASHNPGMVVADNSPPDTLPGTGWYRTRLTEGRSAGLFERQECAESCAGKSLNRYQVEASSSAQAAIATHENAEKKAAIEPASATMRLIKNEAQVVTSSGLESESDKPDRKHKQCGWGAHADACWNDPRWNAANKEGKERLETSIHSGSYRLTMEREGTTCDNKYRFSSRRYQDESRKHEHNVYTNTR